MEDPTPAENQEGFRLIRQHTMTPLAVGEVFNTIYDCQTLITEQLIDYIRTTVVHAGGITHLRRIAHLAELYQVRTGSHGATDLSPVCMGAALHFDLWVHNFGIQEYMRHTPETDAVFPHAYTFRDGYLHPGDAPGHGVDIDESAGREISVQAELAAGQPAGGRHDVELVESEACRASRAHAALKCPDLAARLLQQAYALDPHAAVDRLAHVVDGQQSDAGGGQRFHLDAGAVEGLRRHRRSPTASVVERELDGDARQRQRMRERDQLGRALGRLDRGDARDAENVALAGACRRGSAPVFPAASAIRPAARATRLVTSLPPTSTMCA